MSKFIHKSHNVTILLYHLVCPVKYRRAIITPEVEQVLVATCQEIAARYEMEFIEIGTDKDHVHFLIQSVPTYSATKIARTVKSLTAREILRQVPAVGQALWGGEFWTKGYYMSTVGPHGSEEQIRRYIHKQGAGKHYKQLHQQQLRLDL